MTDRNPRPRCGNDPRAQWTDGDRQAVADARAYLALRAATHEQLDRAEWVEGDPLMQAIASAVHERCETGDTGIVHDDPRNIAAVAAVVARAAAAAADRAADDAEAEAERQMAAVQRVRHVLEMEPVLNRSALEYRGLILSALMGDQAQQDGARS
jgi:hypothetical protein